MSALMVATSSSSEPNLMGGDGVETHAITLLARASKAFAAALSCVMGWSGPSLGPDEAEEEECEGLVVEVVVERVQEIRLEGSWRERDQPGDPIVRRFDRRGGI